MCRCCNSPPRCWRSWGAGGGGLHRLLGQGLRPPAQLPDLGHGALHLGEEGPVGLDPGVDQPGGGLAAGGAHPASSRVSIAARSASSTRQVRTLFRAAGAGSPAPPLREATISSTCMRTRWAVAPILSRTPAAIPPLHHHPQQEVLGAHVEVPHAVGLSSASWITFLPAGSGRSARLTACVPRPMMSSTAARVSSSSTLISCSTLARRSPPPPAAAPAGGARCRCSCG